MGEVEELLSVNNPIEDCFHNYQYKLGWQDPNRGVFSVSSAYELQIRRNEEGKWEGWKMIWRLKVQQCVKIFIWLLAYDKVLTKLSIWRRRLMDNSDCRLCREEREDSIHAIRDCMALREVWNSFLPSQLDKSFFSSNLRDWLLGNL